jgi:hypothetical protein
MTGLNWIVDLPFPTPLAQRIALKPKSRYFLKGLASPSLLKNILWFV